HAHGDRQVQGLQLTARLVRGIPAVPPQGRQGRQGGRRPDVRDTLRGDDAEVCRANPPKARALAATVDCTLALGLAANAAANLPLGSTRYAMGQNGLADRLSALLSVMFCSRVG